MSLQSIGRYQIVGELGKGAMGIVYKATDPTIGRTVALKTMRLDVHGMDAEEMLKRFRNEARAAGVLNHPNIVTVYDAGEQGGLFYMALELIEGYTLHALLAERRVLPVEQVIDISRQVCAGLDYAHSHGVIHRDIKPANIMITPETVKIMDFGIAKAGGGLTSAGQVLGTPNYMSPEQVKGRALDGRSDLFSWGVILYEMLTGEKPFTGQNVTTIIYKIVNESPIAPRELDVTIHPGLSAVVTKALAKSPEERYQRGADLVRDLQNYKSLSVAPVTAADAEPAEATSVLPAAGVTPAPAPAAAPPAKREAKAPRPSTPKVTVPAVPQKLLPLGAAVLVLLLAVAGFAWYHHHAALRQQQAAEAAAQPAAQPAAPAPTPAGEATPAPETSAAGDTQPAPAATEPEPAPTKPAPKPRPKPASAAATLPPAPAVTTGDLALVSSPDGAKVQIDGRSSSTWVTPYTAAGLSAGAHTVTFAKPGYTPVTRSVQVAAGQTTTLEVQMAAMPNTIGVTSNPAGATVFLDGKDTGKVTPTQLHVSPGEHKLLLRKEGYKDATTTVAHLNPGDSYNFTPTLEPEPAKSESSGPGGLFRKIFGGIPEGKGALNVKSKPKGAQITIAGLAETYLTPHKYFLDPGAYSLTIKLDGYKTVKKSVTVEKGKGLEINETLQKQ